MREQLIAQHKQLTKQLFRTPAKACTDKRLKYVRYADDFLIAVNGTREECEEIKAKLTDFVRDTENGVESRKDPYYAQQYSCPIPWF